MKNNRRKFIKKASLLSLGVFTTKESLFASPNKLPAKSYNRIIGSNDRVSFAFQGLGRRLPGLLRSTVKLKNIDVMYFCDVMKKQLVRANKLYDKLTGLKAQNEEDIHKIFDDKDVDAIIMATPDHWHSYGACKALQANKHIYLEFLVAR